MASVVYRVTHKIPEQDVEEIRVAFGNSKDAEKYYNDFVKKCKAEEEDEHAWARLDKIILADLPKKQLILAIMSDRGFSQSQEEMAYWTQN